VHWHDGLICSGLALAAQFALRKENTGGKPSAHASRELRADVRLTLPFTGSGFRLIKLQSDEEYDCPMNGREEMTKISALIVKGDSKLDLILQDGRVTENVAGRPDMCAYAFQTDDDLERGSFRFKRVQRNGVSFHGDANTKIGSDVESVHLEVLLVEQ
jgi:hypothetical protein